MKSPGQLSNQALAEFKAAYQEEFGRELSDGEVQEMAVRLLRFFGVLTAPKLLDLPVPVAPQM